MTPKVERFQERLELIIGSDSVRSFARKSGVSETAIRKYLAGESSPNVERLIAISETAGVTIEWLVTGKGNIQRPDTNDRANARALAILQNDVQALDMLDEQGAKDIAPLIRTSLRTREKFSDLPDKLVEVLVTGLSYMAGEFGEDIVEELIEQLEGKFFSNEFALIPFTPLQVSAGHGSLVDNEEPIKHLAFRKRWLKWKGFSSNDLSIVLVAGDSMEPKVPNNATIVVNRAFNQPIDGNIYVVRHSDQIWVKRLQVTPNEWFLISENEIYPPIRIPKDEQEQFEVIGQVVHVALDI